MKKLVGAVRLSHGSAAGPGGVYCLMLKRLLESSLEALLGVFNCIWTAGGFSGGGGGHMQWRFLFPGPVGILTNLIIALTGCLYRN